MSASLYYDILFILSVVLTLVYAAMWHKHFDVHITLMFAFIPICNLGFVMYSHAQSIEVAIAATKIYYIGGCFLILFITQSILSLCKINIPKWLNSFFLFLCIIDYLFVLSIGYAPFFYRNMSFETVNGAAVLYREYGFAHTLNIIVMVGFFSVAIIAMLYSLFKKKDVSNKTITLLAFLMTVSVFSYFGGKIVGETYSMIPFSFVFAQVIFLFIVNRVSLYDITDSGIDSLVRTGDTGFISIDFKYNYLGCNETAKSIFPELQNLIVDKSITKDSRFAEHALKWIKLFKQDNTNDKQYYTKNGRVYLVTIRFLYDGRRKRGYQFFLTDDTESRKYIELLGKFNTQLSEEVEAKTRNIVQMHDRLILSMAMMVESRDNSTGGHIRRTSDVVRFLIDEIKKDNKLELSDKFCRDIIKAAPMHDLGKIAVDDEILRKPGRFTPEEFEKMKKHAAEGARIVHSILDGTDDFEFHLIAENVAHYHHERWDGSGYPEGLKGDEIPLEARIMAIADVYDALVSKRVYKERMSFEQADQIIMEGMGKHFDKSLEPYYVAARPEIEQYYKDSDEN